MIRVRFLSVGIAAVFGVALAAVALLDAVFEPMPYAALTTVARSRAEILEACDVHVRAAEVEAHAAVGRHAAEFASFIDERTSGAAAFSREMVSWQSKWRVIKQYLPFTDADGHRKYVEEQFAKHIFSEAEIAGATQLAVAGSLKDLEAIENRLAVQLRAEIDGSSAGEIEVSAAEAQFAAAIDTVVSASQWDAAKTVGNLAVAEVAATVGTQVLVRLGVSTGILGTGAASSWWTLGSGLLLGLVVDAVWQWVDDPAGDIERETVAALESLANDGAVALRSELGAVVTMRAGLWNQAVQEMVP